jgi:hypothetical protein
MDTELQESIRTTEYINTGDRTSSQVQRPEDVPVGSNDLSAAALFGSQEAGELRARWEKIQTEFVDEPRRSVEQADDLVASVTQRLTEMFREQKDRLEGEWGKGEVSTEELRTAFRRYRTLFDRLLSI